MNEIGYFFYSEKQKSLIKRIANTTGNHLINRFGETHLNLLITADGNVFEYTECKKKKEPINFDDYVFIGSDDNSAIIHNGIPFGKLARERLKLREKLINEGKLKAFKTRHYTV